VGLSVPTFAGLSTGQSGATTLSTHESVDDANALTSSQSGNLTAIAAKTWAYYSTYVNGSTHFLPPNYVFLGVTNSQCNGNYSSGTDVGFYLDSIVAARDLGIISSAVADTDAINLLTTLTSWQLIPGDNWNGFPYRWYSTVTGQATANECGPPLSGGVSGLPSRENEAGFVSSVDDAWYAQSLAVAANAFPGLTLPSGIDGFSTLLNLMNWNKLYDVDPTTSSASANQMYIGWNIEVAASCGNNCPINTSIPAATYNLYYAGTRIIDDVAVSALGANAVPAAVLNGTFRTPPTSQSGQAQTALIPSSSAPPANCSKPKYPILQLSQVCEGYYQFKDGKNSINFVPTYGGSMFQALAPNLVVPEQSWAPNSLGANNLNTATVQQDYATDSPTATIRPPDYSRATKKYVLTGLGYPVWGIAPATDPDVANGTNYQQFGAPAAAVKPDLAGQIPDFAVAPYASFLALPVDPQAAYGNIEALSSLYPALMGTDGFYDAIDLSNSAPHVSGQIVDRYTGVNEGSVLMSIDDTVDANYDGSGMGELQYWFARASTPGALRADLGKETFGYQ
jgi:hypothetical protein